MDSEEQALDEQISAVNKKQHNGDDQFAQTEQNETISVKIEQPQDETKIFRLDNRTYNLGIPLFLRTFFVNTSYAMYLIMKNVIQKGKVIEIHHLPGLDHNQKVENKYYLLEQALERIADGKPIQGKHVYKMMVYVFRKDFLLAHILIASGLVLKSFNSIVIQKIINTFDSDGPEEAIGYVFLLMLLIFVGIVLNNKSFNVVQQMSAEMRLNLITYLYKKTSLLTSFQLQQGNIGKLFNVISFDLNILEMMLYFGLMIFYIPLLLLVAAIVLYFRFGSYGLLSILILFFIVPIQLFMGLRQKKFMHLKNKFSDERIKLVSETVDGVRLMKMYAWEEAFEKFIGNARVKELGTIRAIQLFRASDRAFSISFVLVAAFVPILIMYAVGSDQVNSSKIYATLEQLYGLRSALFLTGTGIGFLFQIGLILQRFAEFLRLKKQPITQLEINQKYDEILAAQQKELKKKATLLAEEKREFLKKNPKSKEHAHQFVLPPEDEEILKISNLKYNQKQIQILPTFNQENVVEFENFSSFWSAEGEPTLKNITLEIKKGKQYSIVGKVGTGKTTFLHTLLEELPHFTGEYRKTGSVSFVEQEPYVFSGKFKDNILFGKPYEQDFYEQVIKVCCLSEDLEQLPNGDETEIGEKGINLSGGQKARLSLARAVYSRNDIYLLDDPLSAVDAKVARKLYHNCLNGILKGKTVILVTHQIHFTKHSDEIFILDQGHVSHRGQFEELEEVLLEMANQQTFGDTKQKSSSGSKQEDLELVKETVVVEKNEKEKQLAISKGKLFTLEKEEKFDLSLRTYKTFFGFAESKLAIAFVLCLYAASEGAYTGFYYVFGSYDTASNRWDLFWQAGVLLACFILICLTKYLGTVLIGNNANKNMHKKMFHSIARSPVLYFDQTPSGRILTKFSNDLGSADLMLPFMLFDSIEGPMQFVNICITVGLINYWFFLLAFVLLICASSFLVKCKALIVQSKQLDMIYKSPVFSFFAKTIQGAIHIRIYGQITEFTNQMFAKANDSIRTNITVWFFNRAFSYNQQLMTMVFSAGGIIIALYTSDDSHQLGQTIVYLSMLIDVVYALSRSLPNLDSCMTCVERILQICNLSHEEALILPTDSGLSSTSSIQTTSSGQTEISSLKKDKHDNTHAKKQQLNHPVQSWIKKGSIKFDNVKMKYRQDLDLVLKGTSFSIQGQQRVGCVGRTGAGKSSILQALFRMTRLEPGCSISIDGVDIQTIGLHTLRNAISIIPQIPFVFSGTIRRNLDPLEEYSDDAIWKSLEQTNLNELIRKLPDGLLTDMSNVSSVFSTGQKQLICLARAILKNSKILVLDEATANVDMRTDEFIQKAIKDQFIESTIFTIAHRLNTIADYDKVIVMDNGIVAECDSPYLLLVKNIGDKEITSSSIFAQMVKNTGKDNALNILEIAFKKYSQDNNSEL